MREYKHFGVMLDMSRNGVMRIEEVKNLIAYLEKMGYNMLELYTEDTFKIEDEPYFGYLRGGYSKEEIKELDAYAREHGIELVPCIQTLAHMYTLKRVPQYYDLFDCRDVLWVGKKETYDLLEKMFKTMAECYTSRLINIGMDEAHMLGLGRYLLENGFRDRYDIISEHLHKVLDIAEKYGFRCHMWSDMFFRLANNGDYYPIDDKDIEIPERVKEQTPKNIELTFWSYYQTNKDIYDRMIRAHKAFDREVWFAGGAWTWEGFAPQNYFALKSMIPAMQSCRENGIEHVFITMWGDDGAECSFYSALPSLYAIRQFAVGNEDMASIKAGFKEMFGFDFDEYMLLDLPNHIYRNGEFEMNYNAFVPTLMYQDCFLGIYDCALQKVDYTDFKNYADRLRAVKNNMGELEYVFDYIEKLCDFLSVKAYLGIESRKAYKTGDIAEMKALANRYELAIEKLDAFAVSFRYRWEKENKPFGWEVQDIRLGGLRQRLQTCLDKIYRYINGEIAKIEELEEEVLPFGNKDRFYLHRYVDICTTNIFSHNIFD